jgi:hypothetical protein
VGEVEEEEGDEEVNAQPDEEGRDGRKESKGGRSKVREGEKKDENRGCKIHAGCTKRN